MTAGLEAEWSGRFSRLRMRTVATLLLLVGANPVGLARDLTAVAAPILAPIVR